MFYVSEGRGIVRTRFLNRVNLGSLGVRAGVLDGFCFSLNFV